MLSQSDAARGTTLRACAITAEALSVGHAAPERGGEELAEPCGRREPELRERQDAERRATRRAVEGFAKCLTAQSAR